MPSLIEELFPGVKSSYSLSDIAVKRPVSVGGLTNKAIQRMYEGYVFDPRSGMNVRRNPEELMSELTTLAGQRNAFAAEQTRQEEETNKLRQYFEGLLGEEEGALSGVPESQLPAHVRRLAGEKREAEETESARELRGREWDSLVSENPGFAEMVTKEDYMSGLSGAAVLSMADRVARQQKTLSQEQEQEAKDERTLEFLSALGTGGNPRRRQEIIGQFAAQNKDPQAALGFAFQQATGEARDVATRRKERRTSDISELRAVDTRITKFDTAMRNDVVTKLRQLGADQIKTKTTALGGLIDQTAADRQQFVAKKSRDLRRIILNALSNIDRSQDMDTDVFWNAVAEAYADSPKEGAGLAISEVKEPGPSKFMKMLKKLTTTSSLGNAAFLDEFSDSLADKLDRLLIGVRVGR
jgi:hypothetical protein